MPSLFELLLLLGVGLVIAFWWHTNELKQVAYRIAKHRCDQDGVQFLDDGIALASVRLRRNQHKRIALVCCFNFEFSTLGDQRYRGEILFVGKQLHHVEMAPHKL